jgi:hypothetical protein
MYGNDVGNPDGMQGGVKWTFDFGGRQNSLAAQELINQSIKM